MKHILMIIVFWIPVLLLTGCGNTAKPKPDFSVISSPQIPNVVKPTATIPLQNVTPVAAVITNSTTNAETSSVFKMSPATPTQQSLPLPTATVIITSTPPIAVVPPITTTAKPAATAKPATQPDAPLRGGSWDMEEGFEVWNNPYGDNCSGSKAATGWQAFTSRGQYGSSCFYLNDYAPNVFSGKFSQLVTFDFVDSQAGLLRTLTTQPGHTYQATARIRHVHTLPAMQYQFGVDLTGGSDWQAATVQWVPWSEFAEDAWITHTQTFTADGPQTTIFIKGIHGAAAQGGATYIDGVEVIDQG